jgi:transcriptional regulator with XRE-family HTH domain
LSSASQTEVSFSNRAPTQGDSQVGRRIRELRRDLGLTLKQIAATIGVTTAQFHRYEVGSTRVAASRLMDIARALKVSPADLLGDDVKRGTAPVPVVVPDGWMDIVDLMQAFNSLPDQRLRRAVLIFARHLAANSAEHGPGSEPPTIF